MDIESFGLRHGYSDSSQLENPQRERTVAEMQYLSKLAEAEVNFRMFLSSLPPAVDGRCKAMSYTKLDELVMWAKKGIDA